MDVGGNPTPVVGDTRGPILVKDNRDLVAMASEGFIDGIVHHLVNEVVEAPRPRGADIHSRPLTNRLQAFQHLDLFGAVGGLDSRGVAHAKAGLRGDGGAEM